MSSHKEVELLVVGVGRDGRKELVTITSQSFSPLCSLSSSGSCHMYSLLQKSGSNDYSVLQRAPW